MKPCAKRGCSPMSYIHAARTGELANPLACPIILPLLLESLALDASARGTATPVELEASLLTSPAKSVSGFGAVHDPRDHWTPVKLFNSKPFRFHLRHGLPDRSSARRPAFIAPVPPRGPLAPPVAAAPPTRLAVGVGRSDAPSVLSRSVLRSLRT